MNIGDILAEYFSIYSNRDNTTFFSLFQSRKKFENILISTFLSSIVVMYVFELDEIIFERIW